MATFGERFKFLRTEMNLTQDELVDKFNTTYNTNFNKSTLSQYENDKRKPEINSLEKWSEFFGVSIDYLLGKSDVKDIEIDDEIMCIQRARDKMSSEDRKKMMTVMKTIFDDYFD
ncbi:helix-turn-helix domain-containing protein [Clostridioides difficile]|nr:helix-turn-helix domain-containing protein [Clostridioides difficile]